jgi:hypothetical protein
MTKPCFDSDKEWDFITQEVHRESPNPRNLPQRELLLTLQIVLPANIALYRELKQIYLKYRDIALYTSIDNQ